MCYDDSAAPPFHGPALTTARTSQPALTSADGAPFAAYCARPERPSGTGVLVLPDNRGLSAFYEQLCVRLAEQGHTALAIDYFGRTAGLAYRDRGEDFARMENLVPNHLGRLTRDQLHADWAAAIDHLRSPGPEGEAGCSTVVSLGFCMGGRFAFLTAQARFGLDGVIGLYGYPGVLKGAPGPTQLAAGFTAPVLGLFGGGDEGIPPETVHAFGEALGAAGVPHEFVVYRRAPHGFFDRGLPEFAEASADVWRRTLEFMEQRARA